MANSSSRMKKSDGNTRIMVIYHLMTETSCGIRCPRSSFFLKKNRYELRTTAVMDIMPTSDDVYNIFIFLCNDESLREKFPTPVPPFPPLGTKPLEWRRAVIAFMRNVSEQLLLEKKLRNSDLLNPVASLSKSRVIDFFFQLVRVLEASPSPSRMKWVNCRRRRRP